MKPSTDNRSNQELDLVCFSHLRWNYVFQRPQHVMSLAARERRVFYIEEPRFSDEPAHLTSRPAENGVQVVTPWLARGKTKAQDRADHRALIDQALVENGIESFVAWYYTPMAYGFTDHLKPTLTVYDCMDELAAFNGAPKKIKALEKALLAKTDLMFTGGHSLYEAKREQHPNIHPFPSSIDAEHFRQARHLEDQPEPVDQHFIPHPRLGYYGVIDERIDLDLIRAIATRQPHWQIVLVGPIAKLELADLPTADNIHYLDKKAYADLPRYLAGWDVAIMPFAQNAATRYISPTKTPEYLAGGKPVVSTPIRDVARPYGEMGLVQIAGDATQWVTALEKALDEDWNRTAWLKRVDAFIARNSWAQTWEQMRALMAAELAQQPPVIPVTGGDNGRNGKCSHSAPYDYLIVGAGYAGSVLAERLAAGSGKRVLVIDRRSHIAGNAFDEHNSDGVLIHRYGPHIFHTNSKEVFTYLSRFTEWRPYEHRVLASVDGQLVPIPINLDTINRLYGTRFTALDLEEFYESVAERVQKVSTSEDVVISKVGRELYQKFFRNYTRKQWGLDPSELDASVTARVPVRFNRDDRYFTDIYQAMPLRGYTRLFENLLDHPKIHVMLNVDFRDIRDTVPYREVIFTGPVDEYFDYCFGSLPYRSLHFRFETHNVARYQPAAVINYPNEHLYTRVTEFKWLTGQEHPKTTLVYEYPAAEGDPYYPIPRPENTALYEKYRQLAEAVRGVHFAGRLATYKYYNMDQVAAQALALYAKISGVQRSEAGAQRTRRLTPTAILPAER